MGTHFKIPGLGFWHNLDWVGNYFKTEVGIDVLVSFDLIDAAMSLVRRKEMTKYLYHQQEALWNKIFMSYFDEHTLEKMIFENWEEHQIYLGEEKG
jgi:hypothetical protein